MPEKYAFVNIFAGDFVEGALPLSVSVLVGGICAGENIYVAFVGIYARRPSNKSRAVVFGKQWSFFFGR